MMTLGVSHRCQSIAPSPTLAIDARAKEMKARGVDVIGFGAGEPDFPTPPHIVEAAKEALDLGMTRYTPASGTFELRKAICDKLERDNDLYYKPQDIVVSSGAKHSLYNIFQAIIDPGDEVLLPLPCYSLWVNEVLLHQAVPVFYRCDESCGWNPDTDHMKRLITPKTKAIVVINPNNPTGALYSTDILNSMLQVAREHNLIVFSDEIYDRLVMDGLQHVSTASLAPDLTVVTMNGLSKSHSLCGYRCGWMAISGPRKSTDIYRAGIVHLTSMRLCANALAQLVIPAALDDMETPASMVRPGGRYFEQRKATLELLDTIDGISYVMNRAAFYLFPKLDAKKFGITNDKKFAGDLLRATNILIVPGSGFDWAEPDHFRIVMLPEADQLRQAMTRLGNFLDGYYQK